MCCFVESFESLDTQYSSQSEVAKRVGLHPVLVARITSSLMCEKGSSDKSVLLSLYLPHVLYFSKKEREKFNLGLNMKFSGRNQEVMLGNNYIITTDN